MKLFAVTAIAVGALALAPPAGATVFFKSPSGNIGCALSAHTGVRCDIRHHAWKPPKKPKWCDVDWGGGLTTVHADWSTDVDGVGFGVNVYGAGVFDSDPAKRVSFAAIQQLKATE